jgi:hypothetical protein
VSLQRPNPATQAPNGFVSQAGTFPISRFSRICHASIPVCGRERETQEIPSENNGYVGLDASFDDEETVFVFFVLFVEENVIPYFFEFISVLLEFHSYFLGLLLLLSYLLSFILTDALGDALRIEGITPTSMLLLHNHCKKHSNVCA